MSNDDINIFERVLGGNRRRSSLRNVNPESPELIQQRRDAEEIARMQEEVTRIRREGERLGFSSNTVTSDRVTAAGMAMMAGRQSGRSLQQQQFINSLDIDGLERHQFETLGIIPERLRSTESNSNEEVPETRNREEAMDQDEITPGLGLREQIQEGNTFAYNRLTPDDVVSTLQSMNSSATTSGQVLTSGNESYQWATLGDNRVIGNGVTGSLHNASFGVDLPSWSGVTQDSFLFEDKLSKYMFQIACPGVSKSDLKYYFQYAARGENEVQQLCVEIPSNQFVTWTSKQIDILDDSDMDTFAINIENGVLTAVISKYKEEIEYDSEI